MGSSRSGEGISTTQSEKIRSRLRDKLRDVKVKLPPAKRPPAATEGPPKREDKLRER